jgi:hypothetical protein
MARGEPKGEIQFISDMHLVERIGDVWRVYEDASTYSEGTRTIKLGRMEKDGNGNGIKFASVVDAEEWVKGGKIIFPSVLRAL